MDDYYEKKAVYFDDIMNQELAKYVRHLRVESDYTWRAVARDVKKKYPDLDVDCHYNDNGEITGGFQMDGCYLCNSAMSYLNEEISEWN